MQITYLDPRSLLPNDWNPNQVDPIDLTKLRNSIQQDGLQKAILVRTLEGGKKEILDGEHRVKAVIELGWSEVPCVDVGAIDDGAAKKATLIGNSRYGDNDVLLMSKLLSDNSIGSAEELLNTLPFDEEALTAYFDHDLDLDGLEDIDDEINDEIDLDVPPATAQKTHQIVRFKVTVDDAIKLSDIITRTKHDQGFTESDELTNAGDALIHLIRQLES